MNNSSLNNMNLDTLYDEVSKQVGMPSEDIANYTSETLNKKNVGIDDIVKFLESEFQVSLQKILSANMGKSGKKYHLSKLPPKLLSLNNNTLAENKWVLNASELSKNVNGRHLLEKAELQINSQDKIILVGENGAGKSTLLKILAKEDNDYEGKLDLAKETDIMLIDQHLLEDQGAQNLLAKYQSALGHKGDIIRKNKDFEALLETRELSEEEMTEYLDTVQLMTDYDLYYIDSIMQEVLMYFGFTLEDMSRFYSELSGGERMRFLFASAIIRSPDLLILDEPTNHLDIEGMMWLESLLKKWDKAILCVSHDKSFIESVFNTVMVLDKGKIKKYRTPYSHFIEIKEKEDNAYELNRDALLETKKELETYITQNKFNPLRSAIVDKKRRELNNLHIPEKLANKGFDQVTFEVDRFHTNLLQANKLSFGYSNEALGSIDNLQIGSSSKISIMGANGSGKTTLLKTLLGILPAVNGEVTLHNKAKVAYLSQFISDQTTSNLPLQEIILETTGKMPNEVQGILNRVNISYTDLQRKWQTFSGGEQVKIALVLELIQKPHLLVLDEPTNHLDLFSKQELIEILKEYNGAIIMASHDRDFIKELVEETYLIHEGSIQRMNIQNAISKLEGMWVD